MCLNDSQWARVVHLSPGRYLCPCDLIDVQLMEIRQWRKSSAIELGEKTSILFEPVFAHTHN